jgi:NADPH2:quinone reductase
MQAIVVSEFGGPDQLRLRDCPVPDPAPGEVTIDVSFAAVGLLDVLFRRGDMPELVALPFIPGLEVAGRIRALGAGVSGFEVGQSVVTLSRPSGGGYAEVAVAEAALTIPLDGERFAESDHAQAVAMVPNLVTAIGALTSAAPLQGGESVLVHGAAGGLASALPVVARSLGASRIVGAVGSARKIEAALRCGFDEVYLTEELAERDDRFDLIVDPVGGGLRALSLSLLNPFGRVLVVGNASGEPDFAIGPNALWLANTGVVGFNVGGLLMSQPERARELGTRALGLLADRAVDISVETLPLAHAADAHRRLENREVAGKLVLRMG